MRVEDECGRGVLDWLLEVEAPGARYLALRDVLQRANDDRELQVARSAAHRSGPIATVLEAMHETGHWVAPGPGYNPKYRATVWSIILLAQLGARIEEDARIARACAYLLDHNLRPSGQFSTSNAPSGTVDCLQGNLVWSLLALGCDDPRLTGAVEWMARTVTGEGIAPASEKGAPVRYYAYKCGPTFACGANTGLPCAWGAVKVLLALSRLPTGQRTPLVAQAIEQGVAFLFSVDPADAAYPSGMTGKPSQSWYKFGFPVFYVTDVLQVVEALVALGYGQDPRLARAWELILSKRDADGRWPLEYDYSGKAWVDFGVKREPNKWVSLRALRALVAAGATVP